MFPLILFTFLVSCYWRRKKPVFLQGSISDTGGLTHRTTNLPTVRISKPHAILSVMWQDSQRWLICVPISYPIYQQVSINFILRHTYINIIESTRACSNWNALSTCTKHVTPGGLTSNVKVKLWKYSKEWLLGCQNILKRLKCHRRDLCVTVCVSRILNKWQRIITILHIFVEWPSCPLHNILEFWQIHF